MMNMFKRKSVYTAILAGLSAVGVADIASAVHINPDGLGQALVYPYYTVRDGNDTYLSIVNASNSTKAVKVRFLEGKNSMEVLDFNLYLSPYDAWTGAIVATAEGAKLVTGDKSCTTPPIPSAGQPFVNYQFSGVNADGEATSLDRTREGYFEIIEMGDVIDTNYTGYIKHSNGTPANCGALQSLTAADWIDGTHIQAPSGMLAGKAELLAPALGTAFGFDAVAFDSWAGASSLWTDPGALTPHLGTPIIPGGANSVVFHNGVARTTNWAASGALLATRDAVSATMMHDNIINEFMLDTDTLSGTDWVVTAPTKNRYVTEDTNSGNRATRGHLPASNPFAERFGIDGSCDPVVLTLHDREEAVAPGDFSPLPPGQVSALCWESTVVTFNAATSGVSNVLGSINSTSINTGYTNGWLNMGLVNSVTKNMLTNGADTYFGLPVVGFMVQDYTNNNAAPGVMATYGNEFNHKFTRNIAP